MVGVMIDTPAISRGETTDESSSVIVMTTIAVPAPTRAAVTADHATVFVEVAMSVSFRFV